MSSPIVLDSLRERAAFMRESLQKSQAVTESMVTILGSFDHRLSALESDMRPMQVKTHAIRRAHENIVKSMQSADVILAQFDVCRKAELKIMKGLNGDYRGFLEALNQLKNVRQYFSSNRSMGNCDAVLNYLDGLIATAIQKLGEDFKQLLFSHSKVVEPDLLFKCLPDSMQPSTGSPGPHGKKTHNGNHTEVKGTEATVHELPTLVPSKAVLVLHQLAEKMVQEGHQQQCIKIFSSTHTYGELYWSSRDCRATVLEQTLRKLGVDRLSRDEVHRLQWEVLEAKIGNWIHFMRIAVKILFAGERKVCDQMFEGMNDLKDQCFAAVIANSFSMLLTFGDAIAKINRTPEKLFVLMDMYEAMRELQPDIEVMFEGKICAEMHTLASSLSKRLAQTAHGIFGDFVEAVEKDATRTVVPDGSVHPLTSYVINYVKFLFDSYQATLKQLFEEINNSGEPGSQLASVAMQIMSSLQTNLDGKSKQYRDPALAEIFLMNNVHYIVRSVRRSEAKDLLGDDWVQRHRKIVQQHANVYKRITWKKIIQSLSIQGLGSLGGSGGGGSDGANSSGVTRAMFIEYALAAPTLLKAILFTRLTCLIVVDTRFKIFNSMFEELHQRQTHWSVPESELRESLRLAVIEILLPAYRSFIKRLAPIIENGKDAQKYMRYTPEDVESMLNDFFEEVIRLIWH
ncbi:Exocyst complex component [Nymphaea thermarum]|nr:Exocyst complex component [Nymphaea thermarum]